MEKITFPLTGPANESGVQMLFEDTEVLIMRLDDNQLIRNWKNSQRVDYAILNQENDNPEMIEWKKPLDLTDYHSTSDSLIHPDTGHKITLGQLENIMGSKEAALMMLKDCSVGVNHEQL